MFTREQTKPVKVGPLTIGGGRPVVVQSMTNTDTRDARATLAQIENLVAAGCELVRVAVPDRAAAAALGEIKRESLVPVVADIHFDYRLALDALEAGVDKLRINPGNIGGKDRVRAVVGEAQARHVPIRIGVNAGSLEKPLLERFGGPTAEAMVESAMGHVGILEDLGFTDIVVSLKASDVPLAIAAYRGLAERVNYPLHVGITESGTVKSGTVRSAVGIGAILAMGLGDTIRVSLTGDPAHEVRLGYEILKVMNLRARGPVLISCPTCGRCGVDLIGIAGEVERRLEEMQATDAVKVAVMGCAVNGPGEAREADVGVAGGRGEGLIFRHGRIVRKVPEAQMVEALMAEVRDLLAERAGGGA